MRKFSKLLLAVGSALLCLSTAYASHNQPTTFVGPTVRGGFTAPFSDMGAYSIAGELGPKNYRVGATVGVKIDPNQRFKFTGEYLWQKINYRFFTGDTKQWVQQGALGARYEYDFFDTMMSPQVNLSGYYSEAKSKDLSTIIQTTVFPGALSVVTQTLTNHRRIAGATGTGISPGVSVAFWQGGRVGIDVNYDHVKYHKKYTSDVLAEGWGVTGYLRQVVYNNIIFGVSAADRKPFNNYEGNIGFTNLNWYGNWTVGLYGNYLDGKKTLPNTWNIGISADYILEPCMTPSYKGENFKGEMPMAAPDTFLAWVADPAVHMPQVLAIPDEEVIETSTLVALCSPAITTGLIADQLLTSGIGPEPIDPVAAAGVFSGSTPFTFAMTVVDTVATSDLTIDPATGLITGTVTNNTSTSGTVTVTVTATNSCGSASTTFEIVKPGNIDLKRKR